MEGLNEKIMGIINTGGKFIMGIENYVSQTLINIGIFRPIPNNTVPATNDKKPANTAPNNLNKPDSVVTSVSASSKPAPTVNVASSKETIYQQSDNVMQLSQQDYAILAKYNVGIIKKQGNYYFTINEQEASPEEVQAHLQNVRKVVKGELSNAKKNVDGAMNDLNITIQVNWTLLNGEEQASIDIHIRKIVTPMYDGFNNRYAQINQVLK